jgi:hypothetical protein
VASRAQPTLTVSQRLRVMLCIQTNWLVPVSSSPPHQRPAPEQSPAGTAPP